MLKCDIALFEVVHVVAISCVIGAVRVGIAARVIGTALGFYLFAEAP